MNTVFHKARQLFSVDKQALNDAEQLYLACERISKLVLVDEAYKDDYLIAINKSVKYPIKYSMKLIFPWSVCSSKLNF